MKTPNSPMLAVVISGVVWFGSCLPAMAQHDTHNGDPATRARIKQIADAVTDANRILVSARLLLRQGKYGEVVAECDRAMTLYVGVGFVDAPPAHELLAECYIAQKRFPEAVREAFAPKDCSVGSRLNMTRALALIGAGRSGDAVPLILSEAGTQDEPTAMRGGLA
ncbi:MAG: hypothetical protein ACHQ50_01495, partial [Fimbriimonadales bacterium]